MKRYIYIIIFILCAISASAQTFTLKGRVTDENQDPLELATVTVLPQLKVAFTNFKGEYSLTLASADSVVVKFSMVGYKTKTRVLRKPKGQQTLQIQLFSDNQLDEVTVVQKKRQVTTTEQLSHEDLMDVKRSASVTGNAVEDMIQTQAGVSTHSELSSQYNVRGGAFDENSVYINNVDVYRPFLVRSGQQEGLSVINPDMVESVGFSSGGYEAKYGDKMSSALDIKYRRPSAFEANAMVSLLGASAFVGFSTNKFAWSNGIRYKTIKGLLGSMDTKGEYKPNFLDYQTYMVYNPNKRWEITFLGNISENHYNFIPENRETSFGTQSNVKSFKVYFDGQEKDLFRTYFGTLGIKRFLAPKTSLSLYASAFKTKEQEAYDIQGQYWLDQTETSENIGVGTYMEHTRNYLNASVLSAKLLLDHKSKAHDFLMGLTLKKENIKEQSREYEYRDSSGYSIPHTGTDLQMIYNLNARNELDATRLEVFAQDSYRFTSGGWNEDGTRDEERMTMYTLNYGVRFANWSFNKESIVSPRVSLSIVPGSNHDVTWRFAAGLYYQAPFYKELRDTTTANGITTALLNSKIKSQRSIHFIAAYDRRFMMSEKRYRFTAEAYYKALGNLVPYSVSNVKVVYYGTNEASGHAAGVDLKLYGEFVPGTDSWVSFSLMSTKMKLHGKSVALPTDQRYSVNLFFTDYFPHTDRWKMSLKLAFADGLPFAAPHRGVEENNFRAPAYKRCDIGMSYRALKNEKRVENTSITGQTSSVMGYAKRDKKKFFRNVWIGVDCLNLFGINNVNSYYWVTDVANNQYAVPNYLTGRQLNFKIQADF